MIYTVLVIGNCKQSGLVASREHEINNVSKFSMAKEVARQIALETWSEFVCDSQVIKLKLSN